MMRLKYFNIFVIYLFYLLSVVKANEVLGCGGYVRSTVEIDYSQVRIKLLTQQGNLKYETECAPNNGYYFIRLYDKGEYILKVSPPAGWSFEPKEVILKVDGENDPCSLSQDINFVFQGFAVIGRVVSVGSEVGPPGVTVALKQGEKEVLRTVTSDKGDYLFTPLASGVYTVVASHPTWNLIKSEVSVTVSDKNGNAGDSLMIGGFSLSGAIAVNGKIAQKVKLVLHSPKMPTHKLGCEKEKLVGYPNKAKYPLVCHTTPDQKGKYAFSNVPLGKYSVVPHFVSGDVRYVVEPSSVEVEVGHDDVHVQEVFKVQGRSLHGHVTQGKTSPELKGARVTLDGDLETRTDESGRFVFHNVKFGDHSLKVSFEGVEFDDVKTQLGLASAPLPDIVPARYQTCFSVSVDSSSDLNIPWLINVIGTDNSKHEIQTGSSGKACVFLQPGEYSASILLTAQDEEAGIRFGPEEHVFRVVSEPVLNMSFSQFLGEIHGSIECLEACRTLTVSLRPSKGSSGSPRTTTCNNGRFLFMEVVPGEYLLSVDKEEWCWREQTVLVAVNAKNVSAKFEQTGFRLTLNTSHRTTLSYVTNKGHTGKLDVAEGTSRECVSAPGTYVFTPTGCHKFGLAPLTWDTSSPQLLSLTASHHLVTGTLLSSEPGPFSVTVKSDLNPEVALGPLQLASPTEKDLYLIEAWLQTAEEVTLTPSSSSNLFQYNPSSLSLKMEDDCQLSSVRFEAERALFLKGYVKPALKGVTIRVESEEEEGEALTFTTNAGGFFIAGPLDKSRDYMVTAEKTGYILKPAQQRVEVAQKEVVKMSFEAYKLAEILVRLSDESGGALEGVLVSTSGGKNYRQNSLTEADGTFAFQSLMPGDYFLRPMMKEYTFEPPSKMVQVEGGATVHVQISGVRVAYSILGQTISLSGEPEGDVMVEAIGTGEKCLGLQEEALSDAHGAFRIRGLAPNCDYTLQLKKGTGVNEHVDRSLPGTRSVRIESDDFRGIKVVVLRPFLQMDVTVYVTTERRYLPSLTAELYRDENPDSPVHVVTLGNHPFFMLPPMMMDSQTYFVQLVSSLPHSQYSYSLPSVSFRANESFVKLAMAFQPSLRSIDAEISRGTVFGLIFFVVMVSVILNYNKLQPLFISAVELYQSKMVNNSGSYYKSARQAAQQQQQQQQIADTFIEPVQARKRVKVRKT